MSKKVEKKVEKKAVATVKKPVKAEKEQKGKAAETMAVNVSVQELRALAEFALNTRFFLLTFCGGKYKKGTKGYELLANVDKAGPFVRDIAIRLGVKFDEPKEAKKDCKCNDCKCEKKPEVKKQVAKKAPAKKPVAKAVAKSVKK